MTQENSILWISKTNGELRAELLAAEARAEAAEAQARVLPVVVEALRQWRQAWLFYCNSANLKDGEVLKEEESLTQVFIETTAAFTAAEAAMKETQ